MRTEGGERGQGGACVLKHGKDGEPKDSRALLPLGTAQRENKWAVLHYRRTKEIIQQLDRVMHAFNPSTQEMVYIVSFRTARAT